MLTAAVQSLGSPSSVADEKDLSTMTVKVGLALDQITFLGFPRRNGDYEETQQGCITKIVGGYLNHLFSNYKIVPIQDCGKSFKCAIDIKWLGKIEAFRKALPEPINVAIKPDDASRCFFEVNKYALGILITDQIRKIILQTEKNTSHKVTFEKTSTFLHPLEYCSVDDNEGISFTFKRQASLDEEIQIQFKKYGIKAIPARHRRSGYNSFILVIENFEDFIKQTIENPAILAPVFAPSDRGIRETTTVDSGNAIRALEVLLIRKFPDNFKELARKDIGLTRDALGVYIPVTISAQKPDLMMQYLLKELGLESILKEIESDTYIYVNLDNLLKLAVQQKVAEVSGEQAAPRRMEQKTTSVSPSPFPA